MISTMQIYSIKWQINSINYPNFIFQFLMIAIVLFLICHFYDQFSQNSLNQGFDVYEVLD